MLLNKLYCLTCGGFDIGSPGTWSVEEMSGALEAQPSVVRRHLGFWVMQGVLREGRHDSFTVVEQANEAARNRGLGMYVCVCVWASWLCLVIFGLKEEMDDSDSAMATAEEQKESDLQVCSLLVH